MTDRVDHATVARALARSLPESRRDTTLALSLIRLLTHGQPVALEALAASLGRAPAAVAEGLRQFSNVERDEDGRIVAACGLTLPPTFPSHAPVDPEVQPTSSSPLTAHRFIVEGQALFTWCAMDALMYPTLLNTTAEVTSRCPATGSAIHLTITPARIACLEPAGAVVSLVFPEAAASRCDVRGAFCNAVHFFASAEAATAWVEQGSSGRQIDVVPVADAYCIGQHATALLYGEALTWSDTPEKSQSHCLTSGIHAKTANRHCC